MADYEDVTAFLGQWGPFQQRVFFLLCLNFIPRGFSTLSIVFLADTPSHRCRIPADANLTAAWRNSSIPLEEESHGGAPVLSKCFRYQLDAVKSFSDRGLVPVMDVNLSDVQQEGCLDGWEYDRSAYISTIISEWDLVCDDKWKGPMTSSILFCGVFVGSFVSGQLSDRFGRKIVLFASMAVNTVFGLIQVFSPSWAVFCTMHFVAGFGNISNYVAAFVLGTEILNPPVRVIFSTLGVCLCFGVGYMLLPLFAFFLRDWRMLLLALNIPGFLYIPFWWFIPESPRWLLSQGRVKEAEAILRHAAERNKVEAPQVIFSPSMIDLKSEKKEAHNICDLLRSRNICGISVTLWLVWIAIAIAYFAVSLNTSNLHGSTYFNCFLSAATEMPAYIFSWLMFRCFSRRLSIFMTLFLGGVLLLVIPLIPANLNSLAIAVEMMGKFAVTIAFTIIYPYSAELYPTVLRNTAVCACSMASRVGSISAPYFIYLRNYSISLAYILIGSLTALVGLLSLLLPESYGMPLPDTIAHMQDFPGCCKSKSKRPYKLTQTTGEEHESKTSSVVP